MRRDLTWLDLTWWYLKVFVLSTMATFKFVTPCLRATEVLSKFAMVQCATGRCVPPRSSTQLTRLHRLEGRLRPPRSTQVLSTRSLGRLNVSLVRKSLYEYTYGCLQGRTMSRAAGATARRELDAPAGGGKPYAYCRSYWAVEHLA